MWSSADTVGHGPITRQHRCRPVWVTDGLDDAVVRIDPKSDSFSTRNQVGGSRTASRSKYSAVWSGTDATVVRGSIPEESGGVETIKIQAWRSPAGLASQPGSLWLTSQAALGTALRSQSDAEASPASAQRRTSRTRSRVSPMPDQLRDVRETIDCLTRPPPAGTPGPKSAASLPRVSSRQYDVHLHYSHGLRLSRPASELCDRRDISSMRIDEDLRPEKISRWAGPLIRDIAGQAAYLAGKAAWHLLQASSPGSGQAHA